MPSVKEIKNRINGVRDTQKITNAMYLIASTKMQKARAELDRTLPYFDAARAEVKRIFRTADDVDSIYFFPPDDDDIRGGTCGCLVITADKGLAGSYNQCVLKEAERLHEEYEDMKLFVVGEYGRQYFTRHHVPIERSFLYTAQNPTVRRAREITDVLLEQFDAGQLQTVYIIFTDMKNRLNQEAITHRLLPFHRKYFDDTLEFEKPVTTKFEFMPSVKEIMASIIPSVVTGFIYGALVDSFCCEQSARMEAMDSANRNAEKILDDLSVQYNRLRQAEITQEITEVSAGAKAQKRKQEGGPHR